MTIRSSGILLHITSLPSPYGIGDMGPEAYRFADFLAQSGQRYWQVLPLNPVDPVHSGSPYHSHSAFAGNPLLISPEFLVQENLLSAEDLKDLILQSGEEWHEMVSSHKSKGYASLFLLRKNHDQTVPADAVMPDRRVKPRFSRVEKESIKALRIGVNELLSETAVERVKSAYKRMAKLHHPDMGGRAEDFRRLNEAHEQMIVWAKNPQFTARKALVDCWSYDGYTNRWVPPL